MSESSQVILSFKSLGGYGYGFRSPLMMVECSSAFAETLFPGELHQALGKTMRSINPSLKAAGLNTEPPANMAQSLCYWTYMLQTLARVPLATLGRSEQSGEPNRQWLLIPSVPMTHEILAGFVRWLSGLAVAFDIKVHRQAVAANVDKMFDILQRASFTGSNVPHFLSAAEKLGIPVQLLYGGVLQYGQGKKGRRLDSSFTDQSSHLSVVLAKNKHWTSRLLHDSGFPVPPQALVENLDEASRVIRSIGYPVVIKPGDLDGGTAVAAGLQNWDQVRKAFEEVRKHTHTVLLEKHVPGRDYRLTIFNGQLLWAIERIPAGVTGDGQHSIKDLVAIANADQRRGEGPHAQLKKIILDEEAIGLLHASGKTADTVPAQGEFVALRRRANVASGGMPIAVTSQVHPDNARLAIRAVSAVGLDLAGVDLLIPDIERSWMEVGGAICEINGQPQLGSVTSAHCYEQILRDFFVDNGRIPISCILGADSDSALQLEVSRYQRQGLCVGHASPSGVFVGDECISRVSMSPYRAGRTLLMDRRVEAIVLMINDFSLLNTGSPFDVIDNLMMQGVNFQIADNEKSSLDRRIKQLSYLLTGEFQGECPWHLAEPSR